MLCLAENFVVDSEMFMAKNFCGFVKSIEVDIEVFAVVLKYYYVVVVKIFQVVSEMIAVDQHFLVVV